MLYKNINNYIFIIIQLSFLYLRKAYRDIVQ